MGVAGSGLGVVRVRPAWGMAVAKGVAEHVRMGRGMVSDGADERA